MIRCLRSAFGARRAPVSTLAVLLPVMLLCVMVQPSLAIVVPKDSPIEAKAFRHANLHIVNLERYPADLGAPLTAEKSGAQLQSLGAQSAMYDWRGARWSSIVLSYPLVPGDGAGNTPGGQVSEADVWQALSAYISSHQAELNVDLAELSAPNIDILENGNNIHVYAQRVVGGILVRDSALSAVINHGNLILLGLQNWGNVDGTVAPVLSADAAQAVVAAHVQPFPITGSNADAHLERLPLARGQEISSMTPGRGYDYRLVWAVYPKVADDMGTWEGLVDALTGELIAFQDLNSYAARRVVGGVYPVSNDQRPPDGIEQAGWPMPFTNVVGTANTFTTGSGQVTVCEQGNIQTTLNGQFVQIFDNCGAINENSAAGDLNLGTSTGDDCTVPAGHSVGDTHSARTGFYELNRIKEQARGQVSTAWLSAKLGANMNINLNCNAFWNGSTVNFYRSGGGCGNTGEIAAVFDHEWGHGWDDNNTNPALSNPGEAIADIVSTQRLDSSCVGRGFFLNQVCGGYGDPCTGTPTTGCTGVRDADFAKHVSGQPHGITWILSNCGGGSGPCGREVHCEGQVPSEVGWDLHARDLMAAPFNFDENTSLEMATRLMYVGMQTLATWYTCAGGCQTTGTCGCGATGGYLLTLGADDDNGNLADGTPHMGAIRSAFERHQLHCTTQTVINSGCAGGPTTAPVATAVPSSTQDAAVDVSWNAVPGAANYAVYRTEGTNGCSFGKIKVGTTSGTTFTEGGLLDGRTYLYSVMPVGANASCFGLMSNCSSTVPSAKNDPCVPVELQTFEVE
jgi:trimeric autotransporter adhesin